MKRTARVVWTGGINEGGDQTTTGSGKEAKPEELVAPAHARCFSMALAQTLDEAGLTATSITTDAEITLDKSESGYEITGSHLIVTAEVPGAKATPFEALARKTLAGSPISKLLRNPITMTARLA